MSDSYWSPFQRIQDLKPGECQKTKTYQKRAITFREVEREAVGLQRVDGDHLQVSVVGEESVKHGLVLLQQRFLSFLTLVRASRLAADVLHHHCHQRTHEPRVRLVRHLQVLLFTQHILHLRVLITYTKGVGELLLDKHLSVVLSFGCGLKIMWSKRNKKYKCIV